jgi:hypothetical protein
MLSTAAPEGTVDAVFAAAELLAARTGAGPRLQPVITAPAQEGPKPPPIGPTADGSRPPLTMSTPLCLAPRADDASVVTFGRAAVTLTDSKPLAAASEALGVPAAIASEGGSAAALAEEALPWIAAGSRARRPRPDDAARDRAGAELLREEVRLAGLGLARAREREHELAERVRELESDAEAVRRSLSWRVTAPLRAAKRLRRHG